MFSLWSRTQKSTLRRAAGDSVTSRTESLATRHCIRPASDLMHFVVQSAVNVQFMVKDSKKYAATGGWGFGDFKDGKPGDEALHKACFRSDAFRCPVCRKCSVYGQGLKKVRCDGRLGIR